MLSPSYFFFKYHLDIYFESNYFFTDRLNYFRIHQIDQVTLKSFPHKLKYFFTIKSISNAQTFFMLKLFLFDPVRAMI
jgi:hypothetical protein